MLKFIGGAFQSTVFLIWLVVALGTTTVTASIWAVSATYQVGAASVQLAAAAATHRRQLSRAILRVKAKARLRRFVVAIPVAGVAAVAVFEELDYREWSTENPDGTRAEYGCEVYGTSVEVLDEFMRDVEPVLAKMPSLVRPSRETVIGWLPECAEGEEGD